MPRKKASEQKKSRLGKDLNIVDLGTRTDAKPVDLNSAS